MLFIAVAFIFFLGGMEIDIFIPSYPILREVFNLSPAEVQLCLSLNFVPYCIGSLYAGALGDRYGLRKVILYSLVVFVIASFACVFASSFSHILLGRIFQGLGMAAPASLGYVVIAERYPPEKQASLLGTLNGFITVAMAFAPVIGSYVTIYAGWRGNFIILLVLSLIAIIFCFFLLPKDSKKAEHVSLSLKTYLPLLVSKTYWRYLIFICALICCYWTFIGMGPILYVEGFGVSLDDFGFYQGALAGSFAIISFLSPKLLSKFGHQKCFKVSTFLVATVAILLGVVGLCELNSPMLITVLMCLFTMPMVFPVNILYPIILEVVPDTKSRSAALVNVTRLIISAICIELVSYFYDGRFLQLGLTIAALGILAFILSKSINHWKNEQII
jgi:DHA1 family bicyclomycin/chloramphenicol resistance-like MFS transporter